MSRSIFVVFVAAVSLLPLPFAGVHDWAWTSYAMAVGLLLLGTLFVHDRAEVAFAARRLAIPLGLGLGFCLYVGYQAVFFGSGPWQHPLLAAAAAALPERTVANSVALDGAVTLDALTRLLAYLGTFWLAHLFARSSDRATVMLRCFVLTATAYSVYGLIEFAFLGNTSILWFDKYAYLDDLTATFINRNSFATYAGLGIIASLAWLIRSASQIHVPDAGPYMAMVAVVEQGLPTAVVPLTAFLLLAAALLLSHSRAGLFSTGCGVAALLGLLSCCQKLRKRMLPLLIVVVVCAGFVVGLSSGTLGRIDGMTYNSERIRLEVYAIMLDAIAVRPWTGYGYGNFEQAFGLFSNGKMTLYFDRGHNDYLELLLGVGVPAAALLLLALGWLAVRCVFGVMTRHRNQVFPAMAAAGTVLVGLHATVDFSLQMPAVAASFAFLLGIGTAQSWREGKTAPVRTPDEAPS